MYTRRAAVGVATQIIDTISSHIPSDGDEQLTRDVMSSFHTQWDLVMTHPCPLLVESSVVAALLDTVDLAQAVVDHREMLSFDQEFKSQLLKFWTWIQSRAHAVATVPSHLHDGVVRLMDACAARLLRQSPCPDDETAWAFALLPLVTSVFTGRIDTTAPPTTVTYQLRPPALLSVPLMSSAVACLAAIARWDTTGAWACLDVIRPSLGAVLTCPQSEHADANLASAIILLCVQLFPASLAANSTSRDEQRVEVVLHDLQVAWLTAFHPDGGVPPAVSYKAAQLILLLLSEFSTLRPLLLSHDTLLEAWATTHIPLPLLPDEVSLKDTIDDNIDVCVFVVDELEGRVPVTDGMRASKLCGLLASRVPALLRGAFDCHRAAALEVGACNVPEAPQDPLHHVIVEGEWLPSNVRACHTLEDAVGLVLSACLQRWGADTWAQLVQRWSAPDDAVLVQQTMARLARHERPCCFG